MAGVNINLVHDVARIEKHLYINSRIASIAVRTDDIRTRRFRLQGETWRFMA